MLYKTNKYSKEWQQYTQEQAWEYFFQILPQPIDVNKDNCPVYMFAHADGDRHDISTCTDIYAIMLDYDDGTTPEQFVRSYSDLQAYWYTSKSHTPANPRFRVILPLMEPIAYDIIHNPAAKAALQQYFPGNDATSYVNLQCVPNRGPYYSWGYNLGECYSLARIKPILESPEFKDHRSNLTGQTTVFEYKHVDDYTSYACAVRKAHLDRLQTLPRAAGQSSYSEYCSLVGSMLRVHANGQWIWEPQDIINTVYAWRPEPSIYKMICNFASRRQEPPQKPAVKTFSGLGK